MSLTDALCQQKEDSYRRRRFIRDGYDRKFNILHIAEVCDNRHNILPLRLEVTEWPSSGSKKRLIARLQQIIQGTDASDR